MSLFNLYVDFYSLNLLFSIDDFPCDIHNLFYLDYKDGFYCKLEPYFYSSYKNYSCLDFIKDIEIFYEPKYNK